MNIFSTFQCSIYVFATERRLKGPADDTQQMARFSLDRQPKTYHYFMTRCSIKTFVLFEIRWTVIVFYSLRLAADLGQSIAIYF